MRATHLCFLALLGCGTDTDAREACAARDASVCGADGACLVTTGFTFDEGRACVSERRAFCVAGPDCDDAFVLAVDDDGARWWFPSSCLPPGFDGTEATEDEHAALEWADCPAA